MRISTLKRRAEFQRVRGGGRWSATGFVMEGKRREENSAGALSGPRFGFTVTKKLGGAVVRNRIRRRLRAAIAAMAGQRADPAFDYVLIAREAAFAQPYGALCTDLETAFGRVNSGAASPRPRSPPPVPDSNVSRRK